MGLKGLGAGASAASRLLFDEAGNGLIASHCAKASRRYRYDVTRPEVNEPLRIPAGEIEPLSNQTLVAKLDDRPWLMALLMDRDASPDAIEHLQRRAAALATELRHATASVQRQALHHLVERRRAVGLAGAGGANCHRLGNSITLKIT